MSETDLLSKFKFTYTQLLPDFTELLIVVYIILLQYVNISWEILKGPATFPHAKLSYFYFM